MANKGLITCIGASTIIAAGVITSLLGQTNKLENQLKAAQTQQATYQTQTPEVISTPQPQSQYVPDQPMPASRISSDLPPQNVLLGYTAETVPVITQHWHQGYATVPRPAGTVVRWALGKTPYIPERRRVPVGPVIHSHLGYQIQFKPIVTSMPRTNQPQYQLPPPPQPGFR
ncbi:MAG: hypothetical protein WC979_06235 [Candidatus Pacearchaeota archaeon]